jgi:hypothetical protein
VVAKSFSSALLFIASPNYFLAYTAGDHVLYQLYRIVRCDYLTFLPGVNVPLSFICRICEKTIVDFTSCWLLRYAPERGERQPLLCSLPPASRVGAPS